MSDVSLKSAFYHFMESRGVAEFGPYSPVPAAYAFYTGAAAMAEVFATHQAPTQELIRTLMEQIASDSELLRRTISEAAGRGKPEREV
jgi:hypothetical protein